jgi:hypothetical protein
VKILMAWWIVMVISSTGYTDFLNALNAPGITASVTMGLDLI